MPETTRLTRRTNPRTATMAILRGENAGLEAAVLGDLGTFPEGVSLMTRTNVLAAEGDAKIGAAELANLIPGIMLACNEFSLLSSS